MNNDEAQLILQAYRQGGQDAKDPRFHEALAQARHDPELAEWLANEQALDARTGAKIRAAMQPPAQLRSQLLAQRNVLRSVVWWKQPIWRYAAAACLALLVTIAAAWLRPPQPAGFAEYRNEMTGLVAKRIDRLDLVSRDLEEVRRWLTQKDSHGDLVLPAGLNDQPSLGCRLLDWNGHQVSLICFELKNRQMAHLLVINSDAFPDAPPESPSFNQIGEVATVGWSHEGKTYVIASKGGNQLDMTQLL